MELNNYLKQLLYQHDCVIVPGLGGFVCAHKKLEFNIQAGYIIPARKTVAFNQNLNTNDGLLANHLVQKEKIGFQKALENINAWVSALHYSLQQGETITIEGLGSLSFSSEKKIVFVPFANVNFSQDSYGLATLDLGKKTGSVKTTTTPQPVKAVKEKPKKEQPEPKPSIAPQRKKRSTLRTMRRVLGIVILLILLASVVFLQDHFFHSQAHKGSMLNFDSSTKDASKDDAETLEYKTSKENNEAESSTNTQTTEPEQENSLQNTTITQLPVESSASASTKTDSVFYIIAGAFRSERNAKDLRDELNRKGFSPEIINLPNSSLYRVGYNTYDSRLKAESKLNDLRNKTHNYAAWVLAVKP